MKRPGLVIACAILSTTQVSSLAVAENFPTEIENAAREMASACQSSTDDTIRTLVTIFQMKNGDILYSLDGSQTPCGDAGTTLCGTGGCNLKLIRSHGDSNMVLYDEQVWSWEVSPKGSKVIAKAHPTYCGGLGFAKFCEVTIDTRTGKKRVSVGR